MPLEEKIKYVNMIKDLGNFKEVTVCEGETRAYEYWQTINPNKDDCCNLRKGEGK